MADRYPGRLQLPRGNFQSVQQPQRSADPLEGDPLAELARLIGQTDPQSHFARGQQAAAPPPQAQPGAVGFSAGTPSWLQTAQANLHSGHAPAQQYYDADEQAHDQEEAEPELTPMPSFLRNVQAEQQAGARYDHVLYGEQAQQQHYADQYQNDRSYDEEYAQDESFSPEFLEQEAKPRRRGGMVTVAVVLGLAAVGTASAYGYRSYVGSPHGGGAVPVVKADPNPTKVVPPTSQSADASNKMFVDRVASADGAERIVPREEQPVDLNSQRSVFPAPRIAAPAQGSGSGNWDEPRKIRTVPIRTDQPTAVPQTAPPAPRPVATQPVAGPKSGPGAMASANAPMSLTPATGRTAAPVQTAPVNPTRGGFLVQIASNSSEAGVQSDFRTKQSKYANLLGSWSPIVKRIENPEKGVFYRALVGPFASQEEASKLCSNLKIAGGDCVVQRN